MAQRRPANPEKQAAHDLVVARLDHGGIKHHELARTLFLSRGSLARKLGPRYPDRFTSAEIEKLAGFLELTAEQHAVIARAHSYGPSQDTAPAMVITGPVPTSLTSFVGREWERGTIKRLLATNRLLTLSGAGGCGKTRLAQEVLSDVARLYRDGTAWVDLSPILDSALVPHAITAGLGLRERAGSSIAVQLREALQSKELLLVLDNCEHLAVACASVVDTLLRACPSLNVLVTSREPLSIGGETVWRVPSLPVPPEPTSVLGGDGGATADMVAGFGAVRLFCDRAASARPDFALLDGNATTVARICRHLDGIPLAIELAAARVSLLSVDDIERHLRESIHILSGGGRTTPPRHQTLRAALDSSYVTLTQTEQVLFHRLATFVGGFELDAAGAVGGERGARSKERASPGVNLAPHSPPPVPSVLDLLDALVKKSLVQAETGAAQARYRLLEPIRAYASELLTRSGEADAVAARHRDWYLVLAEATAAELRGPKQQHCLALLQREQGNLRAALAWSVEQGDAETAIRLGMALWQSWEMRGQLAEGRSWFERLVPLSDGAPLRAQVNVRNVLGMFVRMAGEYDHALRLFDEALRYAREDDSPRAIASVLNNLGGANWSLGRLDPARAYFEEALSRFRQLDATVEAAGMLANLGMLANRQVELAAARSYLEQSLTLFHSLGDIWAEARVIMALGATADAEGDWTAARTWTEESLRHYRGLNDERGEAWALAGLASVTLHEGDYATAGELYDQSLERSRRLGDTRNVAVALLGRGRVALRQGRPKQAWPLLVECLTIRHANDERWGIAECLEALAGSPVDILPAKTAATLLGVAAALRAETSVPHAPADLPAWEATRHRVCRALGEESFAIAYAEGPSMSLDTLINTLGRIRVA
jgi:predicted ATPase